MIYLDNAATTPPDPAVLDTFNQVYQNFWANPHSMHRPGERAEQLLEQARVQVSDIIGGKEFRTIFTSGATESNNLVIKGVAEQYQQRGKHIITTNSEHPSVENVMRYLEGRGFSITRLPVTESGAVTAEQVSNALTEDTILVSTIFVNNESGAITPVAEIAKILKSHRAFYHVDGVQAIGKIPFRTTENMPDFISLSAHKFFGLKGSGALIMPRSQAISAQLLGGGQEFGIRSGTADVPRAASFAKALRLAVENIEEKFAQVQQLNLFIRKQLASMPTVICNSPENASPYILNFSISGVRPETILHALSKQNIYISTVSACSSKKAQFSPVILALTGNKERAANTIRISMSHRTAMPDVQRFTDEFSIAINKLR
jgi:cysteine desulfurase